MVKVNFCSECLEKRLRLQVGQKVTAETAEGKVYSGVLVGVRAAQGRLKIILQEGRGFRVVDYVKQLSFTAKREEASA